jgi:cell division protein FtsZ
LLSIQGGSNLGIFEINDAARLVQEAVHPEANIIFGAVIDDTLGDEVRVTVIAAGFDGGEPKGQQNESERRAAFAAPTAAPVLETSLANTGALAEDDRPTDTGSWVSHEPVPVGARSPLDPAFDDDDDLDIPDFLK